MPKLIDPDTGEQVDIVDEGAAALEALGWERVKTSRAAKDDK